jgi:hypothetical protein
MPRGLSSALQTSDNTLALILATNIKSASCSPKSSIHTTFIAIAGADVDDYALRGIQWQFLQVQLSLICC